MREGDGMTDRQEIERPEIDSAALECVGVSAFTQEASTRASGDPGARVDGSDATVAAAGAAISDEAVEGHARAVFELENPVYVWDDCSESARLTYRAEARLHLAALVASGYRREADVLRAYELKVQDLARETARLGKLIDVLAAHGHSADDTSRRCLACSICRTLRDITGASNG